MSQQENNTSPKRARDTADDIVENVTPKKQCQKMFQLIALVVKPFDFVNRDDKDYDDLADIDPPFELWVSKLHSSKVRAMKEFLDDTHSFVGLDKSKIEPTSTSSLQTELYTYAKSQGGYCDSFLFFHEL